MINPLQAQILSAELVEWLKEKKIPYEHAMPVLAVSIGSILKQQARAATTEHLEQGYRIACEMIRASAFRGR